MSFKLNGVRLNNLKHGGLRPNQTPRFRLQTKTPINQYASAQLKYGQTPRFRLPGESARAAALSWPTRTLCRVQCLVTMHTPSHHHSFILRIPVITPLSSQDPRLGSATGLLHLHQARLCYQPPPTTPGSALLPASTNRIRLGSATSLYQTAFDLALLPASSTNRAWLCY